MRLRTRIWRLFHPKQARELDEAFRQYRENAAAVEEIIRWLTNPELAETVEEIGADFARAIRYATGRECRPKQ